MKIIICENRWESEISANDWLIFDQLTVFLKPFAEACDIASGEKYPSLGLVVPLFNSLLQHITTYVGCETEFLSNAANSCNAKLLQYYNLVNINYHFSTMLDPRLRLEYYHHLLTAPKPAIAANATSSQPQSGILWEQQSATGTRPVPASNSNVSPPPASPPTEGNFLIDQPVHFGPRRCL